MLALYVDTTADVETVRRHFSLLDHLLQLLCGSNPRAVEAKRTALLSCHFVTARFKGFLTIISEVPLQKTIVHVTNQKWTMLSWVCFSLL